MFRAQGLLIFGLGFSCLGLGFRVKGQELVLIGLRVGF